MVTTARLLELRVKQLETANGISGISEAPIAVPNMPVDSVYISKTTPCPMTYGTWSLLDSGNLLGGQVGTVYAWQRTA